MNEKEINLIEPLVFLLKELLVFLNLILDL